MVVNLPDGYYCHEFFGLSDPKSLDAVCALRYKVWEDEGTPTEQLNQLGKNRRWVDTLEKHSYHWAIIEKATNQIVAAARLLPCENFHALPYDNWYTNVSELPPGRIGHMGRDVVLDGHRAHGLGTFLNIQREIKAKQIGIDSLIADIPQYRKNSFSKLGFREIQKAKPGTLLPSLMWSVVLKELNLKVYADQ